MKMIYEKTAQSATEYAILIAAVLAGFLALQVYYQRAVKGNMKGRADSIGEQFDLGGGRYVLESRSVSGRESQTMTADVPRGNWSFSKVAGARSTRINRLRATIEAMDIDAKYTGPQGWAGGEVSSAEYVDRFATPATAGHSVYVMGNITDNQTSVWDEAGL
jgi:hypothetical protein